MCGIIGVFPSSAGEPGTALREKVEKGIDMLRVRGRDGSGFLPAGSGFLGHTLHAVVSHVPQPLVSRKTGAVLVANCEIYNWKELPLGVGNSYASEDSMWNSGDSTGSSGKGGNSDIGPAGLLPANDAEALLFLLDSVDISNPVAVSRALSLLDGVYAFAYFRAGKVLLARDIIGVKPVWFSNSDGFSFASERKVLENLGFSPVFELNPRHFLVFEDSSGTHRGRLSSFVRPYFELSSDSGTSGNSRGVRGSHSAGSVSVSSLPADSPVFDSFASDSIVEELAVLFRDAVRKRVPEHKVGVLFSGGVDSTLIALVLKKLGVDFKCYTTAVVWESARPPEDLVASREAARLHGFPLEEVILSPDDILAALPRIVPLIEDTNVVKVGVALALDAACRRTYEDGCKVVFSGLGSEEIFAGYNRHRFSQDINRECLAGLRKIYERDLYRDDVVSMSNGVELRLPFLDRKLVEFALKIPGALKIKDKVKGNVNGRVKGGIHGGIKVGIRAGIKSGTEKFILRLLAEREGMHSSVVWRKKKAAQYGSNSHKALKKLSRKAGFRTISSFLASFYGQRQLRLASLLTSGKDSHFATFIMHRQNYNVVCAVTLKSSNRDSYMFHTPNIGLVEMQAKLMGLPLVQKETSGVKEAELGDLRAALMEAVKRFSIEGVITGALYSNYQRDRIEKICDELGLKVFSPLWHIDQETELRQIISPDDPSLKFEVWLASVACDGLDSSWLGRPLLPRDIDRLAELNRSVGINVAGEGGEYESMVLASPMFRDKQGNPARIVIEKFRIEEESRHVARILVEEVSVKSRSAPSGLSGGNNG